MSLSYKGNRENHRQTVADEDVVLVEGLDLDMTNE